MKLGTAALGIVLTLSTGTGCGDKKGGGSGGTISASEVSYDPAATILSSEDLQSAVSEVASLTSNLEFRVDRPVLRANGKEYSLNAVFCGATTATAGDFGDNANGPFRTAKASCEALASCGSPAHMCTMSELIRTDSLGSAVPNGWIADGPAQGVGTETVDISCDGFRSASLSDSGTIWDSTNHRFAPQVCAGGMPILCCM